MNSIGRAEGARQRVQTLNRFVYSQERSLSCTVKARLVGGCLVITLPSEIKKAAQIEAGDSVSLAIDESGNIKVERVEVGR